MLEKWNSSTRPVHKKSSSSTYLCLSYKVLQCKRTHASFHRFKQSPRYLGWPIKTESLIQIKNSIWNQWKVPLFIVAMPLRKHHSWVSWGSLIISGFTSSPVLGCSSLTGSHSSGRTGRNFLDVMTLLTTILTDTFWSKFSISKNLGTAIHCTQTNVHFQNTVAELPIRNNFLCYFQIGLGFDWFWPVHSFLARLEVIIRCRTARAEHHIICCQHLGTPLVVYINYVGSWREIKLILVRGKFISQASTNRDAVSQARQRHEWIAVKCCRKT